MATVSVDTSLLNSGGVSIETFKEGNKAHYNNVINQTISSCPSFESFKSALEKNFSTYSNHCEKASSRIIECAEQLENVDSQISGEATSVSEMSANGTEDALIALQSSFSISDTIDYTFDPSNVGISAQELYSKAQIIKNANIPTGTKIVQMAKLLHEYTYGWKWSSENLVYNKGFEGTLEIPSKLTCCATGVSDVLWLSGFVDTIANQNGEFNPNFQENVMVTAEKKGWQKITATDFDQLQPGDIMFTSFNGSIYGHVEIYAGNGYAYSWGSTADMAREGPKLVSVDKYRAENACAYRVIPTETV